jgi:hypothetical protein
MSEKYLLSYENIMLGEANKFLGFEKRFAWQQKPWLQYF